MDAHPLRAAALAALALAALPSRADAQASATWPTELTERPLTLKQDMVELQIPIQVGMSAGQEGHPVFLNPSLFYALTDRWSVGLRHFAGFCLGNADHGCAQTYNDASFEAVYAVGEHGPTSMAARLAINWAPIDPATWSAEAGVVFRARSGRLTILFAPAINVGMNKRDQTVKVTGSPILLGSYSLLIPTSSVDNREYLLLPATLQVQVMRALVIAGAIAVNGPLDPKEGSYADFSTIPVSVALVWSPLRSLDVGAHFTWTDLSGAEGATEERLAGVFATIRR